MKSKKGDIDKVLQVQLYRKPILAAGKGMYVFDEEGKRYLDLNSGQFCLPFGHDDAGTKRVVRDVCSTIIHTNTLYLSTASVEAASTLATLHPKLQKSFILSTGAEAVEFAIRNARFATGKKGVAALKPGYHGLTLATQSITSGGKFAFPKVPGSYYLPIPRSDSQKDITDALNKARLILSKNGKKIAAVIFEPVVSSGGMIFLPKEYIHGLRELTLQHQILLISDECQTGLGRIGSQFGFEKASIVPDMVVLAKNAGLGFPVSAVLVTKEVAEKVEYKLLHFSSHQNDPLPSALISYCVKRIKKDNYVRRNKEIGSYLLDQLKKATSSSDLVENVRGEGLMLAFDLKERFFTKDFNPGLILQEEMEKKGVLIQAVKRGRVFRILPSYIIQKKDINFLTDVLAKSLDHIEKRLGKIK